MLDNPRERVEQLDEGLNATGRIILLGLVMDAIYQIIVLKRFYPAEAVSGKEAAFGQAKDVGYTT